MDFITASLIFVLIYGVYSYIKNKYNYFEVRGIPYIKPVPVLGNFASMIFKRSNFQKIVKNVYDCHPDAKYVGIYNYLSPIIMIRDLELVKNITIKDSDNFPDHNGGIDPEIDPLLGNNLISMKGSKWREARNFQTPAFTGSKMKNMFDLMVPCAANLIKFVKKLSIAERKLINTKNLCSRYANDVIATCAFGISVDSFKNQNNDFYKHGLILANFSGSVVFKFMLMQSFPKLTKFLKFTLINKDTRNFFIQVMEETIRIRKQQGIVRTDIIQLLMEAQNNKKNENLNIDTMMITSQAFAFFLAGFENTSIQMCLMLHELAINPEVHERLQQEVDNVRKNLTSEETICTYDIINSMPYLDAVFTETMRKHPQIAWLDRECIEPYKLPPTLPGLKPYILKPGEQVLIPVSGIQMDPKYYEDPEKFNPDRFLNKRVSINETTYLSFGIGPRSCIGNRFAIIETKVLMYFLLSNFNVVKSIKTTDPLVYSMKSGFLKPKDGFWVGLEERK